MLAQGRCWKASLGKGCVVFELNKAALPEELYDLRDLRIEVPLERWNRVVKNLYSDRKLLGGLLLDDARPKDRVGAAVANDRLLAEFQRLVLDATAALVESSVLTLTVATESGED
jgi:hypothetical protein